MIGLFLILTSTFFTEVAVSIGKFEAEKHRESIYMMGFLNVLWATIFFLFIALFIRQDFLFSFDSLPTLSIRAILEIAQAHVTMLAILYADRSSFGFIRIGTIPLLLAVDMILGYTIGFNQIIGIGIIVLAFVVLLINHGIRKSGLWYVVFITINAVATISLFKYNITHFNAVEAEQSIILVILLVYFFIMAFFVKKENPVLFLKKPIFFAQSFASGLGAVLISFAFLFAPASIITAAKRSITVLFAILSGKVYFHEKHLFLKIVAFILITIGLTFLVI